MARRSSVLVLACSVVSVGAASSARGDTSAFQLSADVHTQWVRALPEVQHSATDDQLVRPLGDATIPTGTPATFLGAGFALELVVRDHLRLPLLGLSIAGTIGGAPRVRSSIDGSIVEVDTWKTGLATLLLPGYGFRAKERRWMFEGAVQPGMAYLFTSGSAASGAQSSDMSFHATTFVLQADLAACRRIDPVNRACLFVAPTLYEFGWWNGGTIGLRWEVGP